MMTVMDTEEIAVDAMRAGLDDFIVKSPSQFARLADIVRLTLEHKEQELALKEAEVRYKELYDSIPVGLFRTKLDGQFVSVNQALVDMLGYPDRESLMAINAFDLYVNPEERSLNILEIEKHGVLRRQEHEVQKLDGTIITVEISFYALRDNFGEIVFIEGYSEDISERKRVEEALSQTELLNKTIIESVHEGVVVFDRNLRYVVWNPFMERLSGVKTSDVIGKSVKDVALDLVGEKIVTHLMKVLEGEVVRSSDIPYVVPDSGKTGWVEGRYGPLVSRDGEVNGVVGTIHDITQRKESETEREKLLKFERERAREFASLTTAATTISSKLDINKVLQVVAKELTQLLGLDACSISSWDPEANTITLLVEILPPGRKTFPEWYLPTDVSPWPITTKVLVEGSPAQMNVSNPDLLPTSRKYLETQDIKSLLMVALISQDKIIGLVELEDFDEARKFSEQEVGLAQMLCNQAAVALENAHLFDATQHQLQELRVLHSIATFAQDTTDEDAFIEFVTNLISETFYPHHFGMLLLDQRGEYLIKHPSYIEDTSRKKTIISVEEGISGKVANTGTLMVVPDVSESPDYLSVDERTRSEICVPLKIGERVVGVINVESTQPNAFNQSDERFLESLAGQVAAAMENARLYEELESSFVQTVLALANAMDLRDSYTADHSQRMAVLAEETGQLMGCTEDEIETLHWAAMLHDIGKIGVPDEILLKPKPLTEEEYEVIKKHPAQGASIVAPVEKLKHVAPIIHHHQEKFDGSGYPDGLKGEEIPHAARILMVVDAYVAMTDGRVYREARSHKEAIEELTSLAGIQFDPGVVEVFVGSFETEMDR
jgi:PAS domain S-box-containing protein